MTCNDIEENLKPFMEDLLGEEEYLAFHRHLEGCPKCRDHVGAFDSFAGHIWKLGDVEVPSDFGDTVFLKLRQSLPAPREPQPSTSKSVFIWAFIAVLIAATLYFAINYFKLRESLQEQKEIVLPQAILEENGKEQIDDEQAEVLYNQLKGIARTLGVSEEEAAPMKDSGAEKPLAPVAPVSSKTAAVVNPVQLHWHFRFPNRENKNSLLNTLTALGVKLDYRDKEFFIFTATKEQLTGMLNQNPRVSQENSPLRNLGPATKGKHHVSLYLENEETPAVHWHISAGLPGYRPLFKELVRKNGGTVTYKSGDEMIFSVLSLQAKDIKTQIAAMRIMLDEYGSKEYEKEGSTGLIIVSVYFSK